MIIIIWIKVNIEGIDIWISVMIICLTTQITERRGTAMYYFQGGFPK